MYRKFLFIFLLAISQLLYAQESKIITEYPVFTRADSLLGYPYPERTCYDVTYYDLDIVPDIKNKSLSGVVEIHYTAVRDFKKMQIDLYPQLEIKSIEHNGKKLKYDRSHTAVFVHFKKKIRKGAQDHIVV